MIQVEMAPPTTPEKSRGKTRPGGNDDLIPLLIAANADLTLNYSRMRDIDPQKRTYYALEHKFRKFKARAKEICNAENAKDGLNAGGAIVEKAETKSTSISSNQHEDLIPLIIAASPGKSVLNFNRMKQLDPHGRTASSFEHKFRKYKAAAKDILDADEGNYPKSPTKRRKTKGEGPQGESDTEEKTPTKRRRVVKGGSKNANTNAAAEVVGPEAKHLAGVGGESHDDEADRETVMAKKESDNANEAAEEEEPGAKTTSDEDARLEAAVAKKRKPESQPKPRKKGLARIVKRESTFLTESESESEGEEELMKARSVQNKRKPAGAAKSGAKGKGSKGGPTTTEYLAENAAASEPEGATAAGVGESPGAAMLKESAIRLLFE